ncbi:hypothetical protein KIN20_020457 [Parelaphostrongylus tenuis]|uniref:NR LBD domain-containing protein n=1 Tax=Parelaphostrongylus tenuis TaxID=148309 RepID=A0AAD5N387_PARTN|nr:hypothetical protein KIN20_020457 [Parelaphostrongylus tenuis]
MRYDSYRKIDPNELPVVAHRNLLSTIDWVDHLFDIMDIQNVDDKVATVKHCFTPLMVVNFSVSTAKSTKQPDIVCVCNSGYLKQDICIQWNEPYHFANRLAERSIDELISPFRLINIKDEEAALLKAIIIANPYIKGLTSEAGEAIADLRDRIQETLYHVVREMHPKEVSSSRFGNLLLFIPSVTMLGTLACENLHIVDSFGICKIVLCMMFFRTLPSTYQSCSHSPVLFISGRLRCIQKASRVFRSDVLDSCLRILTTTSNFSSNSLPSTMNGFELAMNTASSMPNLYQMPECNPDCNKTLTPDMYTGTLHQNSSAPTMSSHVNSHQQQLCKSNSFPPQYFDRDQYNSSQCMEYEDSYYE